MGKNEQLKEVNSQNLLDVARKYPPTSVNTKIFSEFPMQPKKDTIVYMKPFFKKRPEYIGNGRYKIKDCENGEFNKIWTERLFMKQQQTDL